MRNDLPSGGWSVTNIPVFSGISRVLAILGPVFFVPLLLAIIFSLFPLSVSFPFSLFPCFTPCVFRGFISCLDYHRMIIDIGFRCRFAYRVFIMQLSLSFCVFAFLSRVNVSSTRLYLVLIIYFRYDVFSVIADF